MKIAFVIQKLAARSGGAERVLIETANEMARRGYKVDILSHENRGVEPFYRIHPAVTHTNLFNRPIEHKAKERWKKREKFRENLPLVFPLNYLRWRMTHAGFVKALRTYIKQAQPDVMIPFLPAAITPCALAAKGTGVKVIASTHNEPSQDYDNPKRWDPNPIDIRLRKEVLPHLDKILVLLPNYMDWYPSALHDKIMDMPNPVRQVDSELLNNASREKVIIGVGRLADVKRYDVLFDAWADLDREFPDWRVEIYGDGPRKSDLKVLIKQYGLEQSVHLKGTTPDIPAQLLRASVFCHPSEFEGFPLAVCEALAHGLPVVGFADCSGLNSLVRHEETGILVEPSRRRAENLREALKELLQSPEIISRFGAAAPGSVAKYAPEAVYDRWEAVINEVADSIELK